MAKNILNVKSVSRGLVTSITVPIDTRIQPDGGILSVTHDLGNLRTTFTYRPADVTPPEYLMLLTNGSSALNVFERESISKGRSAIGRVIDVRPDAALILLGGRPVYCTSQVKIKRGDSVMVFMPPGSVTKGIVQGVMSS